MYFLIPIGLGLFPAMIASSKGRNFFLWWLYGAALFIIALPHSFLIKADIDYVEQQKMVDFRLRKCPFCSELIKEEALICKSCGKSLNEENKSHNENAVLIANDTMICPLCAETIKKAAKICRYCKSDLSTYTAEINQEEKPIVKEHSAYGLIEKDDFINLSETEQNNYKKRITTLIENTVADEDKRILYQNLIDCGYLYYERYTKT